MEEKELVTKTVISLSDIISEIKFPINVKKSKFGYYKVKSRGLNGKVELGTNRKGEQTIKYFFGKYSGVIVPNPTT